MDPYTTIEGFIGWTLERALRGIPPEPNAESWCLLGDERTLAAVLLAHVESALEELISDTVGWVQAATLVREVRATPGPQIAEQLRQRGAVSFCRLKASLATAPSGVAAVPAVPPDPRAAANGVPGDLTPRLLQTLSQLPWEFADEALTLMLGAQLDRTLLRPAVERILIKIQPRLQQVRAIYDDLPRALAAKNAREKLAQEKQQEAWARESARKTHRQQLVLGWLALAAWVGGILSMGWQIAHFESPDKSVLYTGLLLGLGLLLVLRRPPRWYLALPMVLLILLAHYVAIERLTDWRFRAITEAGEETVTTPAPPPTSTSLTGLH